MFSPQKTYADVIPLADDADEATKAQAAEWREVFADVGLSHPEARDVVQHAQAMLKDGPPSDQTRASWRAESSEYLRRTFGANASKTLAEAQRYVARDWRVQHYLQVTGLGDSPRVLKLVVEKMRSRR